MKLKFQSIVFASLVTGQVFAQGLSNNFEPEVVIDELTPAVDICAYLPPGFATAGPASGGAIGEATRTARDAQGANGLDVARSPYPALDIEDLNDCLPL